MDEGLSSRVENILKDILGDDIDLEKPRSRVEALLLALAEYISEMGGGGPEAVYLYIAPSVEYDYNIGELSISDYTIYTDSDRTGYIYDVGELYDLGIIGSSLTPKALYLVDVSDEYLISIYPATVHMTYNKDGHGDFPVFSTMPIHRNFSNPDAPGGYVTITYQLFGEIEVDTETETSVPRLVLSIHELSN